MGSFLNTRDVHHNNYYFIRQLSSELDTLLRAAVLCECYSQNKDELVLAFLLPDKKEFYITATLGSEFSCLHFPEASNRARRNSITLFEEILGEEVLHVVQYENERAFSLFFSSGFELAFKLFGNRANIILYKDKVLLKIFKNNLKQDRTFVPLHRELHFSLDALREKSFDPQKLFFTFDPLFLAYLDKQGYTAKNGEEKFQILSAMLSYLQSPSFFTTRYEGKVVLSLFDLGQILSGHRSAIQAINDFYSAHFRYNFLQNRKEQLLTRIQARIKSTEQHFAKTLERKIALEQERSPAQIADLLMANLHQIPANVTKVTLLDFYSGNEIDIKLKKDLSPQKNAEALYKKAKRKPIELEMLQGQIQRNEQTLMSLTEDLQKVQEITAHKALEPFEEKYSREKEKTADTLHEKFRVYEHMGYRILVGRHAENNDELTQKFAHKDDLWLHAKDVSGSHVIIKHQSGKKYPKPVIEAAASLAAWFSKRKNENLCPVMYTEKKYVRKIKGAPKGAVKVERETVIMVTPQDLGGQVMSDE